MALQSPPPRIGQILRAAAQQSGIPPDLLTAVAWTESRYNPRAVSPKGAAGLMQLMPRTAAALGVSDPMDPEQNARGGARFLARLHAKYGDWSRALAAYNWGPGNVDRAGGSAAWPPSVRGYVAKVLSGARRTPRISSPYGMRQRPGGARMHEGIDIAAPEGTPVYAVLPGRVTHATGNGAPGFSRYGRTVVIEHPGGWWTLYAHLSRTDVQPGQLVRHGQQIGAVGTTAGSWNRTTRQPEPAHFERSAPHLHFEVRSRPLPAAYGSGNVEPAAWLRARGLPLPTSAGPGRPLSPRTRQAGVAALAALGALLTVATVYALRR